MIDLKITEKNRISFQNGDFELVDDTDTFDRLKQHIFTGCKILLADWILDYTKGIDYITGLRAYPDVLRAQIKNAIKQVFGVDQLLKFNWYERDNIYYAFAVVVSGNDEITTEWNYKI